MYVGAVVLKTYFYKGEEIDENQLISRIQNGEEELFSLISSSYLPVINRYVSVLNCLDNDRDDFVQIGLLALCGAIDAYDFKSSSFSTFASLCIKRAIISELRHISSKKQIPASAVTSLEDSDIYEENNPESAFIDKESTNVLTDKIKSELSSFEYKVLIAYLKYSGYSEVASFLGITVKEVDNALQRARKKIMKSIGGSL